jgi:phage-related minor tail protein
MATLTKERSTPIVEYSVSDAAIEQLRARYTGLTIQSTADYERVRVGIGEVRDIRVQVEKTRVELKADALAYGRKVDTEAKRITGLLLEIEEPLKLEKAKVDDEKARIKREKEEAERAAIAAELKAKLDAEEAAQKAERDRIAAEQQAESDRLAKERAELEKERAAAEEERRKAQAIIDEQNRIAQAKLDEEAAKLKAEREKLAREQFEREAKERAEADARAKVEREAAESKRLAEIEAEEREHRAAMAPDFEKLAAFAKAIEDLPSPDVTTSEAIHYLHHASEHLNQACELLHDFAAKYGKK